MLECSACLCSLILPPLCQSSPMSRPRKRLVVFPLRKPTVRVLVRTLCFCILASHQCHLTEMEQEITTPPVIEPEQCKRRAIVRRRLLDGKGPQRVRSSTQRVSDASFPVITPCEVKGQLAELVHVLCGLFLLRPLLKEVPNESMQPTTSRRTDFGRQAFTDLVMAEGEASLTVGMHETCACRLKETFLNRFALLLLDSSKERGIKGAPNDRSHPQVIDT